MPISFETIVDSGDATLFDVRSKAPGPQGSLPITAEMLLNRPSGDLFGWSQNAGMGWNPRALGGKEILILSTHGGIRADDGTPIALGYHTGHWEVGLLMQAAAKELRSLGAVPFAAYCTDPCDGRTQGTPGMFDSLPYRNDAATIFRRLIRSLPTRSGVIGVATCDKGLPAMMMALAAMHDLPCVLVPGGVTLLAEEGEDAGRVQSVGARFAHNQITLEAAAGNSAAPALAGRRMPVSGHGGHLAGRRGSAGHVADAFRARALGSSDLARYGAAVGACRAGAGSARPDDEGHPDRRLDPQRHGHACGVRRIDQPDPAPARHRACRRAAAAHCGRLDGDQPAGAAPGGCAAERTASHPTVQVFLAGGVPEVMLHLRRAGLLRLDAHRQRRNPGQHARLVGAIGTPRRLPRVLRERDGVDPDYVIMDPDSARRRGLTSTVTFPVGNLAPEGSVIKSTAIDPSVIDADGVYRKVGPARVFRSELAAIHAIKSQAEDRLKPGDILVLICRGPMGAGMEEIYQITSALKHLDFGKADRGHYRRAIQRRLDRRLHRPCFAGGAGGRAGREGARRRHDRDHDRLPAPGGIHPPGRQCRKNLRRGRRRARSGCASDAAGSRARSANAGGFAIVGGAAERQRRNLGRVRVRCGCDREDAGSGEEGTGG